MDVKKFQAALSYLQQGGLAIVTDDESREAEGDLVGLGAVVTPGKVNFMTKYARGLMCAPVGPEIAKRMELPQMTADNTDPFGTAFTLSVDHRTTTTGISAYDRAATIKALADPNSQANDFYRPGHIFPLTAQADGVLARDGHTEAAVDLAQLAGLPPVAYICEILQEDGHMARRPRLEEMADEYGLPLITVADIQTYQGLKVSDDLTPVKLPTAYGDFKLIPFADETLALTNGNWTVDEPVLVRLHSECLTGEVLGSERCDCGPQLHAAMQKVDAAGQGAIIYLRQEGRGIGLLNKLKAYHLQENGFDTVEANQALGFAEDERNYQAAAQILRHLGITKVRLMTNNPDKIEQLKDAGIDVIERVPLEIPPTTANRRYLKTKQEKLQHYLHL